MMVAAPVPWQVTGAASLCQSLPVVAHRSRNPHR